MSKKPQCWRCLWNYNAFNNMSMSSTVLKMFNKIYWDSRQLNYFILFSTLQKSYNLVKLNQSIIFECAQFTFKGSSISRQKLSPHPATRNIWKDGYTAASLSRVMLLLFYILARNEHTLGFILKIMPLFHFIDETTFESKTNYWPPLHNC